MKKRLISLLALVLCAVLCATCAFAEDMVPAGEDLMVSADYDWERFKGKNVTLYVYNWGLYISDGSDDSINVLEGFDELTGIKVHYTTFDTNESMYSKIKSGAASYDLIFPSDYMIGKMIAEDMLAPLDFANIPNFERIGKAYKGLEYDPEDAYSVPYMWGTVGIVYNTTKVQEAPTSRQALWALENAGNVLMFNNSRDAFAIAAKKLGMSLNPSSQEDIDIISNELKAQKSVVQAYVMDEIFDKMAGGEAALAPYYAGDALIMMEDNP
ncbi:MAG: extracellular solute-binding protein, partial [Oscillospiraceae bacterium]|nr:extracellular solute-binding protein [Oscillospiraceae bacterium]